MSEPLVVAILLVNGREAMVRRAVASFRAQSYENKRLFLLNTGDDDHRADDIVDVWLDDRPSTPKTIGALRNYSCRWAAENLEADIICHFDSDDWSHPQRIAEQVALLQASGADCVGYYEAPFWDTRPGAFCGAWLYRDPARKHVLGASMAYWRKTWERRPFDDINHGEDTRFCGRCKTVAVSGLRAYPCVSGADLLDPTSEAMQPRIVCGIHGGNTSGGYDFTKRQQCFTRAPQFDDYCRGAMQL